MKSGKKVCKSNFAEGKVGRPNSLDKEKVARLIELYYNEPYSLRELAQIFGVSRSTVWRAIQTAPAFSSTK